MQKSSVIQFVRDDFGRRSGLERRQNRQSACHDERRRGLERRKTDARRSSSGRRSGMERRLQSGETSGVFWSMTEPDPLGPPKGTPVCVVGPDRRNGKERRSGFDRRDFTVL